MNNSGLSIQNFLLLIRLMFLFILIHTLIGSSLCIVNTFLIYKQRASIRNLRQEIYEFSSLF